MFPLAGKTAEPNGLTFFVDTQGQSGVDIGYRKMIFSQKTQISFLKIEIFFNQFFLIFDFKNSNGNAGPFS